VRRARNLLGTLTLLVLAGLLPRCEPPKDESHRVEGFVRDGSGAPVAGLTVNIYVVPPSTPGCSASLRRVAPSPADAYTPVTTTTDARGWYQVDPGPAGDSDTIAVVPDTQVMTSAPPAPYVLDPPQATFQSVLTWPVRQDFTATRAHWIQCALTPLPPPAVLAYGAPLARLESTDGTPLRNDRAAAVTDGLEYRLWALDGIYRVTFPTSGRFACTPSALDVAVAGADPKYDFAVE
jgi:hypothetical protein